MLKQITHSLAYDGAEWAQNESRAGRTPIDISFLTVALEFAPEDPFVLNEAASAALQLGDPKTALDFLQRAVKTEPKYANAWLNLASTLHALNRKPEALEALNKVEALEPGREDIAFMRKAIEKPSKKSE